MGNNHISVKNFLNEIVNTHVTYLYELVPNYLVSENVWYYQIIRKFSSNYIALYLIKTLIIIHIL